MVFSDEHIDVRGGQSVAPRIGGSPRNIDVEEASDRLLLEPLARIARCNAGTARQFRSRDPFT
jgi:hypothetical protein